MYPYAIFFIGSFDILDTKYEIDKCWNIYPKHVSTWTPYERKIELAGRSSRLEYREFGSYGNGTSSYGNNTTIGESGT